MKKVYTHVGDFVTLDVEELAGAVLECPECGKTHEIPIGRLMTGAALGTSLPGIAAEILGRAPQTTALVYDIAIGDIVTASVRDAAPGMNFVPVPLGKKDDWLDSTEACGNETADIIRAMNADLVVGAGSGVIADLTKWAATKAGVPFILYGTAASMNAHASVTATMCLDGIKTSAWLNPASAVLMDTDIISRAPKPMRLAGLGDLVARGICNADWLLGYIIRGKDFCPVPYLLTGKTESLYLDNAAGIGSGDAAAAGILSEACLVSAVSMTMMAGDTSPSSGTEHVFSHYWDFLVEHEGAPKNLHGIQAGIGTILSFAVWDYMRSLDITGFDPAEISARRPPLVSIIEENTALFGKRAALFNDAVKAKWIPDDAFAPYLAGILDRWTDLWEELDAFIGDADRTRQALADAGFSLCLEAIGRSKKQAIDAINYGWRYRSRYTILDMARELGVLPEAAGEILERSRLA